MRSLVAPRRTGETFVADRKEWTEADRSGKAKLLANEWLSVFDGEDVGALSRHPAERWREAFAETGFFVAVHTNREKFHGVMTETLEVELTDSPPAVPQLLYRASDPERARRWSWCPDMSMLFGARRRRGDEIFVTTAPREVFAKFETKFELLPHSRYWGTQGEPRELWATNHDYDEWVIAPGEVRFVDVVDRMTYFATFVGDRLPDDEGWE